MRIGLNDKDGLKHNNNFSISGKKAHINNFSISGEKGTYQKYLQFGHKNTHQQNDFLKIYGILIF